MAYFPMFVDLAGKDVLVVGGGVIAARRIRTLLEFGCEITVVSPEVCGDLREMCEEEKGNGDVSEACVRWKKKMYDAGDLEMEEMPESAADVGDLETGERFGSVADVGDHGRKSHGFFFVLAAATPRSTSLSSATVAKKRSRSTMRPTGTSAISISPGLRKRESRSSGLRPAAATTKRLQNWPGRSGRCWIGSQQSLFEAEYERFRKGDRIT